MSPPSLPALPWEALRCRSQLLLLTTGLPLFATFLPWSRNEPVPLGCLPQTKRSCRVLGTCWLSSGFSILNAEGHS